MVEVWENFILCPHAGPLNDSNYWKIKFWLYCISNRFHCLNRISRKKVVDVKLAYSVIQPHEIVYIMLVYGSPIRFVYMLVWFFCSFDTISVFAYVNDAYYYILNLFLLFSWNSCSSEHWIFYWKKTQKAYFLKYYLHERSK